MSKNQTSFQPGQSGNPAGRPKKSSEFSRKLTDYADKKIKDTKLTYDEAIIEYIMLKATTGTHTERKWAIEVYMNRRYGKVESNVIYKTDEPKVEADNKTINLPTGMGIAVC